MDLKLKAGTALDFETKPTLTVTVNVDDATIGTGIDSSQTLPIAVTDVNEAPVITSISGGTSTAITVPENQTAVTDVQSTDPDGTLEGAGGLTYTPRIP